MKKLVFATLATLFVTLPAMAAPQTPAPKDVQIGINSVYVPGGFDSSSDVYVILHGIFPNGCYQSVRAEVANTDAFNHEVRTIASVNQGMCMMVLIPFQKEVRLGKFAVGEHTLRFQNGDGTFVEKKIAIE